MNSRRKLITGLGLLGLFPIVKFGFLTKKKNLISCAPEIKNTTMKMLTQDGRLVEVDISKMKGTKEKISNKQLQDWVKKDL
jgi:ribosomal protein L1